MNIKSRRVNGLIQDYIDMAISLQYCSDLDEMRKYDLTIDAHDSWVEHGQERLDDMREELSRTYDIHLDPTPIGGDPQQ